MREDNLDTFPSVQKAEMIPIIGEHLTCLENKIKQCFFSISIEEFDWIRNLFLDLSVINYYNYKLCEEEELASLLSDRALKLNYAQLPLDAFWISVMGEYPPTLSKKAIKVLLQFSTSYSQILNLNFVKCVSLTFVQILQQ